MSRIISLRLVNFMVHTDTTIEFDKGNIISICGYNESGKSTIIRAFEVMLYNAHPADQASWIRDGEEFFKLVLTFDDGVVYERYKYYTGASWYRLLKDNQVVYDNKKGGNFINTDGVPAVIDNYLGVIRDDNTGAALNIRRCTDKTLLVDTTGGENYKLLNTILQSDRLLGASLSLNEDKNRLQSTIVTKTQQLAILTQTRDNTKVVSEEVVDDFEKRLQSFEQQVQHFNQLENMRGINQYIGDIKITQQVPTIDTRKLSILSDMVTTHKKSELPIQEQVQIIDTSRYNDLYRMLGVKQTSEQRVSQAVPLIDTTKLNELASMLSTKKGTDISISQEVSIIDIQNYKTLSSLYTLYKSYNEKEQVYAGVSTEFTKVEGELDSYVQKYNLTVCERCGAITHSGHNHQE